MQCNENKKWGKFRPFPLFDGPKKDLGICFPDIHSKSAGCIEKGVFPKYFISVYVILQFRYLFTYDTCSLFLVMKFSKCSHTWHVCLGIYHLFWQVQEMFLTCNVLHMYTWRVGQQVLYYVPKNIPLYILRIIICIFTAGQKIQSLYYFNIM